AIWRVLFPVQAGDLVTPQVFQFAFERHASDETDSGDRAGPQRRRVASHSGAEREIEGSLGARAQARAQRTRSPRARGPRYHDAARRSGLSRYRGRFRDEREKSARIAAHALSALP